MNELFRRVEARCEQFGCEKVKTFQNKIMIICGAPVPRDDHAVALADLCLAIFQDFEDLQKSEGFKQEYPDLQLKLVLWKPNLSPKPTNKFRTDFSLLCHRQTPV